MQTGLLPGRQITQPIFPVNDLTAFTRGAFTLLAQPAVFAGCASHDPVISTGFALVIYFASFVAHHPGLHPDAGGLVSIGLIIILIGLHFNILIQNNLVISY
jgi:hypothetical protein